MAELTFQQPYHIWLPLLPTCLIGVLPIIITSSEYPLNYFSKFFRWISFA
jgi:hypothetical protein